MPRNPARKLQIWLDVDVPKGMSNKKVVDLIDLLIAAGKHDANRTIECDPHYADMATEALSLVVGDLKILQTYPASPAPEPEEPA